MFIENKIINFIQKNFFTEEHSYLDYCGKYISSRKYRRVYLFALISYFCLLLLFRDMDIISFLFKMAGIINIYFLGYLSRKINIVIKLYFKRNRPFVDSKDILTDDKTRSKKKETFSFPSNSIQTSLIFYNVLFSNIIDFDKYKNLLLFLITVIISLSKINRGLHYPTDILFSIIIFFLTKYFYIFFVNFVVRLLFFGR